MAATVSPGASRRGRIMLAPLVACLGQEREGAQGGRVDAAASEAPRSDRIPRTGGCAGQDSTPGCSLKFLVTASIITELCHRR